MAQDRFFIAPYDSNSGLREDVKPWLIPDQAFSTLNNAYVFRGRVRKRFGGIWLGETQQLTRFRILIGHTDKVTGNFADTVPLLAGVPIALPAIGQMFSIANECYTVNALGAPANLLRTDGIADIATFDTTPGGPGTVVINTAGAYVNTPVYYYPALPVMGLLTFENNATNDEMVVGFDTRFAYQYLGGWERLNNEAAPGDARWVGDDTQFFWACTWTSAEASDKNFFVTNFDDTDTHYMRYMDKATLTWNPFRPQYTASGGAGYVSAARIIVPFHNRMVLLNTWETDPGAATLRNYVNRARWSWLFSPIHADAFRDDIPGHGNALDCPTTEAIITAEFVKDRLIVFCERSTWELVFTGNQSYPFAWFQINTELGAESTFSVVPFDKVALGVGNVGIHQCNGINVDRIDAKIPDEVFGIHNINAGVERVYGIRDFTVETVYWTFPSMDAPNDQCLMQPYPTRVLVYNYKNNTWSFNDDSITAFGYFQPTDSITWDSTVITWDDAVTWNGGKLSARFRQVIAGNQEGFTFLAMPDVPYNAAVIQITDSVVAANNVVSFVATDHNLRVGDYVFIQDMVDATGNLTLLNNKTFLVTSIVDTHTFNIVYDTVVPVLAGHYDGGGLITRVSKIDIKTKEYNFYADKGRNAYIAKIDFMVNTTNYGKLQVNLFVATAQNNLVADGSGTHALLGTSTLETFPYTAAAAPIPFEQLASRVWRSLYFQGDGECIQYQITMDDAQMREIIAVGATEVTGAAFEDFQLHAMCIHTCPTSHSLL